MVDAILTPTREPSLLSSQLQQGPGHPPYFALVPTPYNVLVSVDGVAGADRVPEAPPLRISWESECPWYPTSPRKPLDSPDLVLICDQPVTLSTQVDLTQWYSQLSPGTHTVELEYVNLAKDPDVLPSGACSVPGGCIEPILMGVVPAGTQTLTVRNVGGAISDLDSLLNFIQGLSISRGLKNSLGAKVQAARSSAGRGDVNAACGQNGAFLNEVTAQTGTGLTTGQAEQLTAAANEIKASLACP
ncbi:MAG: hypothetical protein HY615_16575 [Candidatus Rokubacteria bacterium]|nr:hypothetical protein [Candidatus Rokubacteria bacterium]